MSRAARQPEENPGLLAHLRSATIPHASDWKREEPMDTTNTDTAPALTPSGNPSFPIVGIGASAGGLEAFRELLRFLPDDAGMAYVVVQHLDPRHESLLPDLLGRATHMPVHEAREGMEVYADQVYVIAPNTDMTLARDTLTLQPRTETRGQHFSIDIFLRSLAARRETLAIGVILSGTAADGTQGLEAIKAAGGMTFAQEPTSAQFAGMPQSAIAAGCVDFVGSPEDIARELTRISRHPYVRQPPAAEVEAAAPPAQVAGEHETEFRQVLRLLSRRTDTDFSAYKPTTLKRRIQRRMVLSHTESMASYLSYLSEQQAEVEALYQDVLIGVTSFFRDPATYLTLEREILPHLLATKAADSPLRVWVPGCSTGEEVYSLAICILEFLAARALSTPIQLFGSDLNAKAIAYARAGFYPPGALGTLSSARLDSFFLSINGSYQIRKTVRDLCIFARHNLLKDPPFSRLDLLSCQNVLIYLGPLAQKKIVQTFHYALAPHGVLLLGPSETIGAASDLFVPAGEHTRQLYRKKAVSVRPEVAGDARRSTRATLPDESEEGDSMAHEQEQQAFDLQHETDRVLARFAPASVVIDAQMEILHFRGDTSPYLGPAPGRASLNLFKMARPGLDLELRSAIARAGKSGQPVKKEEVQVNDHGIQRDINVEVIPMKASATERYFVILFEEAPAPSTSPLRLMAPADGQQRSAIRRGVKDRRIRELEQEVETARQQIRSIIEEFEATNEELQSANEESLSSNEELQSLNEELETSREEIQASNEELLVVNAELQQRNAQAQEAREFADAIVETVREPLLILDADLRVQRANRAFYQFFQVMPADTERRRIFELGGGQWNIPALRALLEELLPTNHAFADYEVEHTFPGIGRRIMLLNAGRIDSVPLILLAMEDITERRRAEGEKQRLLEQREEFMAIASHELKTPVTSLKGYAQMLQARFARAGDERSATALARMNAQLDKLIHLIGELLDVTSIEAGQLLWHSEHFDLDALVRDIVEEVSQISERHQIRIEGVVRTPVSGDLERIGQVLTNLLTNAIKYSPHADRILITLAAGTESATVGVQDFGIGLAPEKQADVFERFFRVSDPEHATFPGLGLGLFISAQIVTRHGGRIWVDSQPGAGSTFYFTVPYTPPQPQMPRQEGEEQHT